LGVQPSERLFSRDVVVAPFSSIMRAQATCVLLLWAVGEQGRVLQGQGVRVLQGQGVSLRRSCLPAKEFPIPGN